MTALRVAPLLFGLVGSASAVTLSAETAIAAPDARARSVADVPGEPAPTRLRVVSPRVAELLSTAGPKYEPPPPASAVEQPAVPPTRIEDTPANRIVRLPTYVVRERKLPTPDEVDRRQLERRVMEHYLGPENGLDRGFLNLITAKQFPLLALFGSISNEARAMALYREDERLRLKAYLQEMVFFMKETSDAATAAKAQREVQNAFRRE